VIVDAVRTPIGKRRESPADLHRAHYVRQRKAFGTTISAFQNTKFELAACSIDVAAGRALLNDSLRRHELGEFGAVEAARLKVFCTEGTDTSANSRSRVWTPTRVARIYGGTTEVLTTIIAKSMGL